MKALIKVILFPSLLFISLFCQAQKFIPSVKVGMSLPELKNTSEREEGYRSVVVPYFGLSIERKIASHFMVEGEINYAVISEKRNHIQPLNCPWAKEQLAINSELFAYYKSQNQRSYIEVPVTVQYHFNSEEKKRYMFYHVSFGPYMAILVNAKSHITGTSNLYFDEQCNIPATQPDGILFPTQQLDHNMNLGDEFKHICLGVTSGLVMGYNMHCHRIFVEARLMQALSHVENDISENSHKTRSITITAGYIYTLHKD